MTVPQAVQLYIVDGNPQHAQGVISNFRMAGLLNPMELFATEPQILAALEKTSNSQPLLMIVVPGTQLDPFSLLRLVRQHPVHDKLPIVVMVPPGQEGLLQQLREQECAVILEEDAPRQIFSKSLAGLGMTLQVTSLQEAD